MSTTAVITVLFKNEPGQALLQALETTIYNRTGKPVPLPTEQYGQLAAVEDADLLGDVNDDGSFRWVGTDDMRYSPLLSGPRLQGRLYVIHTLLRFWSTDYREGPVVDFAVLMLTLLACPEVEGVWYHQSNHLSEGGTSAAMTAARIHSLIDDFVRDGKTSFGRPAQYVRSESGSVICI